MPLSARFLILNPLTFSSTEQKKKDTSKKYFMLEQGRARGKIISKQVCDSQGKNCMDL